MPNNKLNEKCLVRPKSKPKKQKKSFDLQSALDSIDYLQYSVPQDEIDKLWNQMN